MMKTVIALYTPEPKSSLLSLVFEFRVEMCEIF